jgi:hypothetical protein
MSTPGALSPSFPFFLPRRIRKQRNREIHSDETKEREGERERMYEYITFRI